jgi:hypothetical protein
MFSNREDRPQTPPSAPGKSEDARDLLARLYRDIGISAVAAALHVTAKDMRRSDTAQQLPPIRQTGKAA